jgi:hypothetical protein
MWKAPIDLTYDLLAAAKKRYLSDAGGDAPGRTASFHQFFKAAVDEELENVWELLLQAGLGRAYRPPRSDSKRSQRTIDRETYDRVQQSYLETDVNELQIDLALAEELIDEADDELGKLEAKVRQTKRQVNREPGEAEVNCLLRELEDLKTNITEIRSQLKYAEGTAKKYQAKLDKALDGYEEPVDISFNRIARCCLVRYAYPDVAKGKAHKK